MNKFTELKKKINKVDELTILYEEEYNDILFEKFVSVIKLLEKIGFIKQSRNYNIIYYQFCFGNYFYTFCVSNYPTVLGYKVHLNITLNGFINVFEFKNRPERYDEVAIDDCIKKLIKFINEEYKNFLRKSKITKLLK